MNWLNSAEKIEEIQRWARQKTLLQFWLLAGVLLVLLGFYGLQLLRSQGSANTLEIVMGEPVLAVHEMNLYRPEKIPFLPKDGPQPAIAISDRFIDLGKVAPDEVVRREFVIQNQGDAPLTITRAYTTCGCTSAQISASIIPPGKAVLVTLIFDPSFHDVRGQTVRRGVIIESNDPQMPRLEIWAQADILDRP